MNHRANIAVMISGRGSNLAALIKACAAPDYPAIIVKVISDRRDALGLDKARSAGISAIALERRDFATKTDHETAILNELEQVKPDLICLAGYMRVLSAEFISHYPGKILNIHPSLLPKYPGLNTHQRALDAGDKIHGCSVHIVEEALDAGPVNAQWVVDIDPDDNEKSLGDKVLNIEHGLYVDAVRKVLAGG
ncbi:MAG: phosphoribosylglycinamide formyltransferase [Hyphomicrobiales bacterium]|nr:phosphoribosylglycinamide formyltransferase [Hyphomicrobiales bacterium]